MTDHPAGKGSAPSDPGVDRAVRVTLPEDLAEMAGAVLMDVWGPFEMETGPAGTSAARASGAGASASGASTGGAPAAKMPASDRGVTLVFYPPAGVEPDLENVLAALPPDSVSAIDPGRIALETQDVPRDWVEGWRDHFHPIIVGGIRIRPPWEPAPGATVTPRGTSGGGGGGGGDGSAPKDGAANGATPGAGVADSAASEGAGLVDVVINPGLGFGTGLHPTTRGTLQLLQLAQPRGQAQRRRAAQRRDAVRRGERPPGGPRGALVDAGTGSGILAIAAAKFGWGPVVAFDNDPVALISARENVRANAVEDMVEIREVDLAGAPLDWFTGATVLANMTLDPILALVRRLSGGSAGAATAGSSGRTIPGAPARLVVSGILAGAQEFELLEVARERGFMPAQRLYEAEWVSLELLPEVGGSAPGGLPIAGV